MNSLTFSLLIALPLLLICGAFALLMLSRRGRGTTLDLANIGEGVHGSGILSKRSDSAIPRYRLVVFGTDAEHVALAGAGAQAHFLALDDAAAAEDLISVQALAAASGTVKMITNGATTLAAGDLLVAASGGRVARKAAAAGNYFIVGVAVTAAGAVDGEELEVIPVGSVWTNA